MAVKIDMLVFSCRRIVGQRKAGGAGANDV